MDRSSEQGSRLEGGLRTRGVRKQSVSEAPLVSVVTVVFNGEKRLEQTILSVVNQTYTNIEYIVIDGASTDGTPDIIKKYDERIDCWVSEPDKGIYDAMNKGIRSAKGDLIGIINAGDYYAENAVETIVRAAEEDPGADIFHGDLRFIQKSGIEQIWRSRDKLNRSFIHRMPVNHPTVFVRSACYRQYGLFDIRYRVAGDFDLMLRFLVDCGLRFHYIPALIATMHGGGESGNYTFRALAEGEEVLKKRNAPSISVLWYKMWYRWLMFVESCQRNTVMSHIFSLYYRLRLGNITARRL